MFRRSDSNCSRKMCRAMFRRSDSNSTMNLCHEKSHPNNSPTTTRTMLSRNIFPVNNAFREIFSDDVSPKDIFRKMFCDALTTASRPSVHPSLSPIPLVCPCIRPSRQSPSSVRASVPLANPPRPCMFVHSQLLIRILQRAALTLLSPWRMKGGWQAETNGRVAGMSRSLCAHAAYALMQPMSFIQDEQR